ncbi:MAG: shikimate kinase [Desulfuromonadaceae bacterium]
MGAGKSTVGTLLAHALGLDFIDTDQLIVQRHCMSINSIFAHYGEAYFRSCETAVLQELDSISEAESMIVSTGGGIVGREENIRLMHMHGTIVYLHASWDTLRQRLSDVSDRPLALNGSDDKLHTLWAQRLPQYRNADIEIDTSGLSPHQVVTQLKLLLHDPGADDQS